MDSTKVVKGSLSDRYWTLIGREDPLLCSCLRRAQPLLTPHNLTLLTPHNLKGR
jgi:hypothetical protein